MGGQTRDQGGAERGGGGEKEGEGGEERRGDGLAGEGGSEWERAHVCVCVTCRSAGAEADLFPQ